MIEDDVRTMLRRRADDITVVPRPWSELLDAPPVVDLRPAVPSQGRWLAVAALLLAVGVAATVLVARQEDKPSVPVQQVQVPSLPFDPATAAPVWAGDPADLGASALAYLRSVVQVQPLVVDEPKVDAAAGLGSVRWAYQEGTGGIVYLRRLSDTPEHWAVVGSADDEVSVSAVSYRDGRLRFAVANTPGKTAVDSLAVAVFVDGAPIALPGETLPQGGPSDPASGVLVRTPQFDVAVPRAMTAPVIRVRQVGGGFLSVTEFAVQPAGGPPGGRLLSGGLIGNETWRIWGVDHVDGMHESPCALVTVGTRTVAGPLCGISGGDPTDASHFIQVGPASRAGDVTLYFGAVEAEVDEVWVTTDPAQPPAVLVPVADPVHPAGARFFVTTPTARPGQVVTIDPRVDGHSTGGQGFPADGPIGG
ncbi:MAG: hypothetical protein QOE35_1580 [Actinomycetota bacterium]|jgi:hypothetical protein